MSVLHKTLFKKIRKFVMLLKKINYWCFELFLCSVDPRCYIWWSFEFVCSFFCLWQAKVVQWKYQFWYSLLRSCKFSIYTLEILSGHSGKNCFESLWQVYYTCLIVWTRYWWLQKGHGTPMRCFGLEKNKIKESVLISGTSLSKKLAKNSYHTLDSYYMFEVF